MQILRSRLVIKTLWYFVRFWYNLWGRRSKKTKNLWLLVKITTVWYFTVIREQNHNKSGNCDALQLEGRPTSRQSFSASIRPTRPYNTSIHLTLPQPPLDSATPISSQVRIFWWLVIGDLWPNLSRTFQHDRPIRGWVIGDSINFHGPFFSGAIFELPIFRVGEWSHQIWGGDREIIGATNSPFGFQICCFISKSGSL